MLYVRLFAGLLCVGLMAIWTLPRPLVPSASAQPCPDIQVVFARGTGEPPGVGATGQAFIDALRPQIGEKSFEVYPVNYPPPISGPPAPTV